MNKEQKIKDIRLGLEVENAITLIENGLSGIEKVDNGIYENHLPLFLLTSGFERLMKCIVCLRHSHIHGKYPSFNFIIGFNHDLNKLISWIINECQNMQYGKSIATKNDMDFLMTNKKLMKINNLLSEFGKGARYYNLDVVTKGASEYQEPGTLIQALEKEIVKDDKNLCKLMVDSKKSNEFIETLNIELVKILERFARALSRLFTLGELGDLAPTLIGYIRCFLFLKDENLGKIKY